MSIQYTNAGRSLVWKDAHLEFGFGCKFLPDERHMNFNTPSIFQRGLLQSRCHASSKKYATMDEHAPEIFTSITAGLFKPEALASFYTSSMWVQSGCVISNLEHLRGFRIGEQAWNQLDDLEGESQLPTQHDVMSLLAVDRTSMQNVTVSTRSTQHFQCIAFGASYLTFPGRELARQCSARTTGLALHHTVQR